MRYYKMMYNGQHNDVNTWCSCDLMDMKGNNEYALMESKLILNWQMPIFKIDENDGKILTDLVHNDCGWHIVSPRFMEVMGDLIRDCVQYLDVEIQSKEGDYSGCKVMHITKSLDALDYEHSVYRYMGENNDYLSITKAALIRSKLDESHIFRLKDDELPVFVSQKFRKRVRENNLLGFSFMELDVY